MRRCLPTADNCGGTKRSAPGKQVLRKLWSTPMMPQRMHAYLRERLPERTWDTRLVREGSTCYLELDATDVDRLARLGIAVDQLGPHLVVCMWDEASPL